MVSSSGDVRLYFDEVKIMLDKLEEQVAPFVEELYAAYRDDRTIFVLGNGGSAASASHLALDLCWGTRPEQVSGRRVRAVSLTDQVPFITASANDGGYETVFVEQLRTLARRGDLLVVISGSGNSPNVLRAMEFGREFGLRTTGVTGFTGGRAAELSDVHVNVPSDDIGLVEAVHSVLFHLATMMLRARVAGAQ